jgi:hypothetical protein
MCRSIMRLREGAVPADEEAVRAAARQFVRKVSGFREPTARHQEAFEAAVDEITTSTSRLLDAVTTELNAR